MPVAPPAAPSAAPNAAITASTSHSRQTWIESAVRDYLQAKNNESPEAARLALGCKGLGPGLYVPAGVFSPDAFSPDAYYAAYAGLRRWIEDSLDIFKSELMNLMFPFFEHSYLDLIAKSLSASAKHFFLSFKNDHLSMHSSDLEILECISTPDQLAESDFARARRESRFSVSLTSTTFQLLISFLEDKNYLPLLRIINTFISVEIVPSRQIQKPGPGETPSVSGLCGHFGLSDTGLAAFNAQSSLMLHSCPPLDPQVREQVLLAIAARSDAQNPSPQLPNGICSPSTVIEKQKLVTIFQRLHPADAEKQVLDDSLLLPPMPPIRKKEIAELVDSVFDMAHAAALSSTQLPSICFYTWRNTYDGLNCTSFSPNTEMIAGGFDDSVVRVHSLTKENLRAMVPAATLSTKDVDVLPLSRIESMREAEGSPSKRLVGHSGPVFSTSFSYDNRYLLSCSEDGTIRLWSMDTFSNVVCYRGHNHPVWDVDFGPQGIYFASASHDRTARLWSCEHIYPLRIFAGHFSDVDTVRFHPNSSILATGSTDKSVRLWDVSRGSCVRVYTGMSGAVQALAFSPDGKKLAVAGDDKYVYIFDLTADRILKRMSGHRGLVTSLSFSAEGSVLASAGIEGAVRLWDVNRSTGTSGSHAATGEDNAGGDASHDGSSKRSRRKGSTDQLHAFSTKHTPVFNVQFTRRNLLLASGPYTPNPDDSVLMRIQDGH